MKRCSDDWRAEHPFARSTVTAKSDKRVVQDREEAKIKRQLWKEQGGKCADCGWQAQTIGQLDKHEHQPRGRGGDPLDKGNCRLVCRFKCHRRAHEKNELATGRRPVAPSALPGRPWGEEVTTPT